MPRLLFFYTMFKKLLLFFFDILFLQILQNRTLKYFWWLKLSNNMLNFKLKLATFYVYRGIGEFN